MTLSAVVNLLSRCTSVRPPLRGAEYRGYVAGDQADGLLALTHPESTESRAQ